MKKEWKEPVLEMLSIDKTMGSTTPGDYLDDTFEAGTHYKDLTWGFDS